MGSSEIGIGAILELCRFFKIGIDKFEIGIEVCYKKLNPQINLSSNFLIQKYFFHDIPTWTINYSE